MTLSEALHELVTNPDAVYVTFNRSQAGFPIKVRIQKAEGGFAYQNGNPIDVQDEQFQNRSNFSVEYLTENEKARLRKYI